ncbi:MAG: type II secretion system protein [Patescibacteria group bacterium]
MINTYMKSFLKNLRENAGFTLIELLVVIGILGVLAAALIATIDPFEQIKKANDTNSKNTTVEFINANIRYYTTHGKLPWEAGQVTGCASTANSLNAASAQNCVTGLIAEGELKSAFNNASSVLETIRYTGSTSNVIACYQPDSKAGQKDPNTIYNGTTGLATTGCKSQGGSTDCYWCSQ